MKHKFEIFEVIFDLFYIISGLSIGVIIAISGLSILHILILIMILILIGGDCFHLLPRIAVIIKKSGDSSHPALGRGKQITSISMTIFYVLLWQLGQIIYPASEQYITYLVFILTAVRIVLCLLPQNHWLNSNPPVKWGILRNIPFFILGMIVAWKFFMEKAVLPDLDFMWLAIILSFAFYLPVIIWVNKNPKIGMLMIPKTCTYLWMLIMLISL